MRVLVGVLLSWSFAATSPKVAVEFEWEEILGAAQYEIEIYTKDKKLVEQLKSPNFTFKVHLPPGQYEVRGRAYDSRAAYSEWSSLKNFPVPPKSIKKVLHSANSLQVNERTYVADFVTRWEPTLGAHHYNIEILDKEGKSVHKTQSLESQFTVGLRPGVYTYRIVPVTADGVLGEAFESPQAFTVQSRPVPEVEELSLEIQGKALKLKWKKNTVLPTWIRLEYQKHFGTRWLPVALNKEGKESWTVPVDLRPGKYRATAWNQSLHGDTSSLSTTEFVIKPKED